ncbi:hypothetical protein [Roseobacter sp.]|uniref:hypothetical protein n=1 Tax=Roseobacter sp. TaxID=1907202 RepID=UPI00385E6649
MARSAEICDLNAETPFGLPHQQGTQIATSVQKFMTLNPDCNALLGYAHVLQIAR